MGRRQKSESGVQVVLIVRHAHRNVKYGREADNGLSEKGLAQEKRIRKYVDHKFGKRKIAITSSPKIRCIETVEKIASKRNVEVKVSELLDEGGNIEKKAERIIQEMKSWRESLVMICSHGDLIPKIVETMTHLSVEVSKGGIARMERREGRYSLQGLLQDFDLK